MDNCRVSHEEAQTPVSLMMREFREKYNITQAELARSIGVSQQAISSWEKEVASPCFAIDEWIRSADLIISAYEENLEVRLAVFKTHGLVGLIRFIIRDGWIPEVATR